MRHDAYHLSVGQRFSLSESSPTSTVVERFSGGFGEVYVLRADGTGELVAAKTPRVVFSNSPEILEQFAREATIWTTLPRHAHIKRAVEMERATSLSSRLESVLAMLQAAHRQCILLASVADRDETSKKELKHLAVAVATSLEALAETVSEEIRTRAEWEFGVPSHYLRIGQDDRARPATGG